MKLKKANIMSTLNSNTVSSMNNLVDELNGNVKYKRVKSERGLIERSENNDKVILTEDNRQVLLG